MTTLHLRKSIGLSPWRRGFLLIPLMLACFALLPTAQGVTVQTLYSFIENGSPHRLTQGSNGNLYGTVGDGNYLGYFYVITPAGNFTNLYRFTGGNDGGGPNSVVQGNDGNFYGTTQYGGTNSEGTVFKITPGGTLTTLHSFTGINPEGSEPLAGLVKGSDGNFYGTTYFGGVNSGGVSGTAFKITAGGTLTTLHSFTGIPDGCNPTAPLIQGTDGNLYGTTFNGDLGIEFCPLGTVFMVTTSGQEAVVCDFRPYNAFSNWGANPTGSVTQGSDGNLYGVTPGGGPYPDFGWPSGYGSVFVVAPSQRNGVPTVLHWFQGTDGYGPSGGLVQAGDGNFYGTTPYGGPNGNGTIFKITTDGTLTTIYSFTGGNDGGLPGALLLANDGAFYVTTYSGGVNGLGAIVRLSLSTTTPTTRYDFNGDGKPDYVLYNASARGTAVWYLNNNVYIGGAYAPTLAAGWAVADVADFNGDGHPDYALFNPSTRRTAIWYLNNNLYVSGAYGPTLPAGWTLKGAVDFNADGKPDYVLFNPGTRQTAIWYLNGVTFVSGAYGPTLPAGWMLVDAQDFNANGKPDYVLFNPGTRQTAIWYLNGTAYVSGAYGPTLPSGWTLKGAVDFNANGKPDYVLFNPGTRQTAIWYLNNNVYVSSAYGPTLPAGWSLAAP